MKQAIIDRYGKEPSTMDELAECVLMTIQHKTKKKCVWFKWEVEYNRKVSNSHSAPLCGVTNWTGDDDKPMWYRGFSGRVWIRYKNVSICFGSDGLSGTLIYSGTGGFGSYDGPWSRVASEYHHKVYLAGKKSRFVKPHIYSYDLKIWLDDWPLIRDYFDEFDHMNDRRRLVSTLRSTYALHRDEIFTHSFLWEEKKTLENDKKFIEGIDNRVLA